MKTLTMILFYVFMLIGGISIYSGLDLKKSYSWLIVVYGFVIGFLMGLVWVDISTAITAGMLFAFLTLASGATVYWTRQRSKRVIDSWLLSEEQERALSFVDVIFAIFKEMISYFFLLNRWCKYF
jgi:hypothetical protein